MKAKRKTLRPIRGEMNILPSIKCRDGSVWVLVKYPTKQKRRASQPEGEHRG